MSIIKGKTNIVAGFGGTKRCIGEVYFSQSSLASDNPGALPGWTGEYYENGKTLFPDLYNFVKAHSELQVTKAEYDSAITSYGECPKYVVDENTAQTSLRLPKYANYIKMAGTEGITQKGAGLPNVTGYLASIDTNGRWGLIANASADDYNTNSGAFRAQNNGSYTQSVSTGKGVASGDLYFDASKSNAIYGASDTVQPAHTTLYPWISAYTSAVPASTAQAAEFTGALSGKANTDLSNCPSNYDYVVESKLPTTDDSTWYRKYKSGWVEQGGWITSGSSNQTTVTLLVPYQDSNYSVIGSCCSATDSGGNPNKVAFNNRATTTFGATTGFGAEGQGFRPFMWEAKGLAAE